MNNAFSRQSLFDRISFSYLNALRSQLQPRMLMTVFLPIFIGAVAFIFAYFLFFSTLKGFFVQWVEANPVVQQTDAWVDNIAVSSGIFASMLSWLSIKSFAGDIFALGLLLPFAFVVVFAVMAFAIMPIVVGYLRKTKYPNLKRCGQHATTYSLLNALKVILIFSVGWVVTLPLWLIPPLALILPLFWMGYALKGFLSVDAIATYASGMERREVFKRFRWDYWVLGLSMAVLNLIPLFWLILPVYSALVFAHFTLAALDTIRQEKVILGNEA